MSRIPYALLIAAVCALSGCAGLLVGSIEVLSTPPGADVYVDGARQGATPLTLADIAAGNHTIELRYPGFASWSRVVEVLPGETLHVEAVLEPVPPTPLPTATAAPTGSMTPLPTTTLPEANETPTLPATTVPIPITPTPTGTQNVTGGAIVLRAYNLEFDQAILRATADTFITIKLENFDTGITHNFAVFPYTSRTQTIFRGYPVVGPESVEYTFRAPNPGIYYFQDDDHSRYMNGILVVNPSARPNYCPVGYFPVELKVRGPQAFDISEIRVPWQQNGDSTTVILLSNLDDGRLHNFALSSDPEGKLLVYRGNSITGIDRMAYSFSTPRPGTYYFRDEVTPGFAMGTYVSYEVPTCG